MRNILRFGFTLDEAWLFWPMSQNLEFHFRVFVLDKVTDFLLFLGKITIVTAIGKSYALLRAFGKLPASKPRTLQPTARFPTLGIFAAHFFNGGFNSIAPAALNSPKQMNYIAVPIIVSTRFAHRTWRYSQISAYVCRVCLFVWVSLSLVYLMLCGLLLGALLPPVQLFLQCKLLGRWVQTLGALFRFGLSAWLEKAAATPVHDACPGRHYIWSSILLTGVASFFFYSARIPALEQYRPHLNFYYVPIIVSVLRLFYVPLLLRWKIIRSIQRQLYFYNSYVLIDRDNWKLHDHIGLLRRLLDGGRHALPLFS